ncbi:glycosyltransferase family 4 protein [Escherichia coli]|uniref:glycosyltransferase n=1 Tax=Escherichia coli TaxID=562 RepID=UPI00122E2DFD|nr:glycosyltransferase [Escherichia coli]EFI3505179.1 glycosyltransferase family 4 protein [Escherichia coli]EHD0900526.1 glycosyltransferase family 4 protein [Escherichia coli]EHD5197455.1 glycosyltransferase family 4 protein [Escherichia coli]EHM3494889.1 glycosyltransferase [Escherichia coli]EJM2263549.1 glycosyltransferase [Escherichia coli]
MFDLSKNYIIVSATALASGGALTILKQFIKHASQNSNDYIMFVSAGLELPVCDNIIYIENTPKGWLKRIYWDWFGCRKFISEHKINVKKVISLQNSSLNVPYEQIIYLHQSIPFSKVDSFLKNITSDNVKLFLYKKFYSYFIFKYVNANTTIVVQTNWMKKGVLEQCDKISTERVLVIKPDIKAFNNTNFDVDMDVSAKTLLYPATPLTYKNHLVILKALVILKKKYFIDDLKFQVTFEKNRYKNFDKFVQLNNLSKNVDYLGVLSYSNLQKKYMAASLIVFPSYIESYGLPLIEAASLGKKIISSDLPYARDVLKDYSGVDFVIYNNEDGWAKALFNVLNGNSKLNFRPYEKDSRSSWPQFFSILK